ncbi:hypothetical protein PtrM4_125010 [Pyrenophora tritici-repentis]|uniref:Retrovirus-related Pol polyprotein from transposon TNT 1-94-like beta-barrel domain-containing protein n=1 Tax=Pyrenophora tritici-repentis TaxID=45151 RepID=A0A834RPN7_9PLEO|nr:hypothetical protein PtrM4_125010 [Pyrenophora tritici-repentis]
MKAAFNASNQGYPLKDAFILDSGSTTHICNNLSRLEEVRPPAMGDYIWAGNSRVWIQGYGAVKVTAERAQGKQILHLSNVAWCPDSLQPRIIQAAPKTRYMVGQSRRPDKPTTMGWFNHCHLIGTLWAMGYRATYYINFSLSCAYESSQTITTKGYCHIMAQTTRTSRAVRDRAPRAAI